MNIFIFYGFFGSSSGFFLFNYNFCGNINDVVCVYYNVVLECGCDWRKIDSRIKGLRLFNNWVKSCII